MFFLEFLGFQARHGEADRRHRSGRRVSDLAAHGGDQRWPGEPPGNRPMFKETTGG